MDNIIYASPVTVPWDTQSAFKMTSYHVGDEADMIYCYLKAYVRDGDLVLNSYQFIESPGPDRSLTLYMGFGDGKDALTVKYGYDGICFLSPETADVSESVSLRTYKADDEQGFYWCGEITVEKGLVRALSGCALDEGSSVRINLRQDLGSGYAVLFDGPGTLGECAGTFTVLRY